jgi:hypothetical protein
VGKTLQALFTANVEKALTFLDDWRHRKMQKTIYRVCTQTQITNRIALDLFRDTQAKGRGHTLSQLHQAGDSPVDAFSLQSCYSVLFVRLYAIRHPVSGVRNVGSTDTRVRHALSLKCQRCSVGQQFSLEKT